MGVRSLICHTVNKLVGSMGCSSSKKVTVAVDPTASAPAAASDCEKQMEEKVAKIYSIKESNPGNIMAAVFTREYFDGLDGKMKANLLKCCASGIGNPGSELGCYAMSPNDYDDFYEFFKCVLEKYHKVDLTISLPGERSSSGGVDARKGVFASLDR